MANERNTAVAEQQRNGPPQQVQHGNPLIVLLERSKGEIAKALPRHLTPERMLRLATTTLRRQPELCDCDPKSFIGAVIQASQLGLELDNTLGHAYLVPFKREVQLIIGYKGYLALARRSGEVATFAAFVVYGNDDFDYSYGTEMRIRHRPAMGDAGPPIAVYAVIKFKDGSHDFEVIPWAAIIEKQRKHGQKQSSPWRTHLEEMARKTAIRAMAKRAPLSPEFMRAAALEDTHESGHGQGLGELLGPSSAGSRALEALEARQDRQDRQDRQEGAEPDPAGDEERRAIEAEAEER